jgi:hydrogenase maturation protease
MSMHTSSKRLWFESGLLAAGIFVIDLMVPAGVALGVLYVIPVLISLWSPQSRCRTGSAWLTSASDAGYETTGLVDVTPHGGEPGTVYLIEPDLEALDAEGQGSPDAHGMNPEAVFGLLKTLGGTLKRVLLVRGEPAQTEEVIGLSVPVARAVEEAVRRILEIVQQENGPGSEAEQLRCTDG